MSLNDNFTLKTLKDKVNTYLKTKINNFRKMTIDNLRYDVDTDLMKAILKEVKPDVKYKDLDPDKSTTQDIMWQNERDWTRYTIMENTLNMNMICLR